MIRDRIIDILIISTNKLASVLKSYDKIFSFSEMITIAILDTTYTLDDLIKILIARPETIVYHFFLDTVQNKNQLATIFKKHLLKEAKLFNFILGDLLYQSIEFSAVFIS